MEVDDFYSPYAEDVNLGAYFVLFVLVSFVLGLSNIIERFL